MATVYDKANDASVHPLFSLQLFDKVNAAADPDASLTGGHWMTAYLFVAAGGALGSCLRYFLTQLMMTLFGKSFPFGTLSVNLLGSLAIGITLGVLQQEVLTSHPWRPFIMVGILGGLTTFSSFSLDTLLLLQQGEWLKGVLNIVINVGCCLLLTWIGLQAVLNRF
ncbi:MAG: fluoride efflux transporter CrcB [Aeromonadaceae bacterium]